jgi:adenosylcobinamide-GDP ribazoletransferase
VVTVVLVLLVQVAALDALLSRTGWALCLVVALVTSRLALPLLCSRGVPAARADGLGRAVAGSVSRRGLLVASLLAAAALVLARALLAGPQVGSGARDLAWPVLCVLLPLSVAGLLARRCVRRLGGVTGDVLGAGVEVTFTTALVLLSLW